MATQNQIEANRRNAEKSTGPKSPGNKSQNPPQRHARRFHRPGHHTFRRRPPHLREIKSDFIEDLAPKTTMELSLASSIAWDSWRLNHLRAVEMNIYALGTADNSVEIDADNPQIHTAISGAVTFVDEAKRFALMSIYEQRMNRSLHKNLTTLRQLQAERKANYQRDLEEEIILARANDINGLPYEAPPAAHSKRLRFFESRNLHRRSPSDHPPGSQNHPLSDPIQGAIRRSVLQPVIEPVIERRPSGQNPMPPDPRRGRPLRLCAKPDLVRPLHTTTTQIHPKRPKKMPRFGPLWAQCQIFYQTTFAVL